LRTAQEAAAGHLETATNKSYVYLASDVGCHHPRLRVQLRTLGSKPIDPSIFLNNWYEGGDRDGGEGAGARELRKVGKKRSKNILAAELLEYGVEERTARQDSLGKVQNFQTSARLACVGRQSHRQQSRQCVLMRT
jgi:hypothetical protein